MNKLQTKVHNVLTALAGKMADGEPREWPPTCFVITYQPMRPETKPEEKVTPPEK